MGGTVRVRATRRRLTPFVSVDIPVVRLGDEFGDLLGGHRAGEIEALRSLETGQVLTTPGSLMYGPTN